ncbi:MAG: ribosome silencing factor [Bacteroidia bacterium]
MATKKTASGKKIAAKKVVKKASAKVAGTKKVTAKTAVAKSAVKKSTGAKSVKKTTAKTVAKKAAPAKAVSAKTSAAKKPATKKLTNDPSLQLADAVVNSILEKKGERVVCLDLRHIENAVCSFFIICEGNSDTQVEAIGDSVEFNVKKQTGQRPYRSEGWENALWVLIDYIDVVVHVFERETRAFYNLERLWADADEIKYSPKGERLN